MYLTEITETFIHFNLSQSEDDLTLNWKYDIAGKTMWNQMHYSYILLTNLILKC